MKRDCTIWPLYGPGHQTEIYESDPGEREKWDQGYRWVVYPSEGKAFYARDQEEARELARKWLDQ